jgi:predicted O-methyltransferase YrrM
MDLVFIDGAHSEDYVRNDTLQALKMIRPGGGVVIWHDAHLFGVVKFLAPWIRDHQLEVYFIRHTSLAVARIKEGAVVPW